MADVFSRAAPHLDIGAAAQTVTRNDLLPSRPEDKLLGQVGRRLWERISRAMERGQYQPVALIRVPVPKSDFTTRSAALLTLEDRVVYAALTRGLAPRIELALASPEASLWPRSAPVPKRWAEFLRVPLESRPTHIVVADVAGFYETISHSRLASLLIEATGQREVVDALEEFLGRVTRSDRGIPQGLVESDVLATFFLSPVDRSMLIAGHDYWRHGDDVRIAASSYGRGREALALFEDNLRELGLNLNGEKSSVETVSGYAVTLGAHEREKSALQQRYEQAQLAALQSGKPAEIRRVLIHLQVPEEMIDELGDDPDTLIRFAAEWTEGLGPYQRLDMSEAIEILRDDLTPSDVETAKALFRESVKHRPGSGKKAWPKEVFHTTLRESLTTLAAADDGFAIDQCANLLRAYPSETDAIATYLLAVASSQAGDVAEVVAAVLAEKQFVFASQAAWLYRVAETVSGSCPAILIEAARRDAEDGAAHWARRAAAIRLLGTRGELTRVDLARLWKQCPQAFRPDLVIAADLALEAGASWAEVFLDACRGGERILDVLVQHLGVTRAADAAATRSAPVARDDYGPDDEPF
ncbi:MAG: RNA-directed DNA polymerase [Acidimicrobiia bacterium]